MRLGPGSAEAWTLLGHARRDAGRAVAAVEAYREALSQGVDAADGHSHLGAALAALGRYDEAEAALREAARRGAGRATVHNNLALVLAERGRTAEALEQFDLALRINPEDASTRKNRAIVLLRSGDLARGWAEYEWRWRCPEMKRASWPAPRWDGSPLAGQAVRLIAEQGLGDAIHFVRYAALVKARGAGRVVLECPPVLVRLLATCSGVDEVVPAGTAAQACDLCAPLLSLPLLLETTLNTIPAEAPYLRAEPERVERWRELANSWPGLRVGIAWQGNPKHEGDRRRSLPLAALAPLARHPGVTLVSLQCGPGAEQVEKLEGWRPVTPPEGWDADGAFLDTAALLRHLDLVVTVDTALMHMAGALGVKAWVLLGAAADWRWLEARDDSPWYPSVRLFRQERHGDWGGVIGRVTDALHEMLAGRQDSPDPTARG